MGRWATTACPPPIGRGRIRISGGHDAGSGRHEGCSATASGGPGIADMRRRDRRGTGRDPRTTGRPTIAPGARPDTVRGQRPRVDVNVGTQRVCGSVHRAGGFGLCLWCDR
eukprot:6424940-Prymnesium_polylepis.2